MVNLQRGMYLESIINYTIEYYHDQEIGLFFKYFPPSAIKGGFKIKNNQHAWQWNVDYHGVYQGKYICFEAKSTYQDKLYFSKIPAHKINYLVLASKHQAKCFFIIYFSSHKAFYLVFLATVLEIKSQSKYLSYEECKKSGIPLFLKSPLYLDFINYL